MPPSNRSRWLLILCAVHLSVSACAAPQRLPAVPEAAATLAIRPPIRYLVTRETTSFSAEAVRALEKEKAYLAQQGVN